MIVQNPVTHVESYTEPSVLTVATVTCVQMCVMFSRSKQPSIFGRRLADLERTAALPEDVTSPSTLRSPLEDFSVPAVVLCCLDALL